MDVDSIIKSYSDWIKSSLKVEFFDDVVSIQTPFLDSYNDYITLFLKKKNDFFVLSDNGRTIFDLKSRGFVFTKRRFEQLDYFLKVWNVFFDKDSEELYVKFDKKDFSQRKTDLVQAIINISDLFLLSKSKVKSLFFEDVKSFFENKNFKFSPNVFIQGSNGIKHKIDFLVFSKSIVLLKVVNNPKKDVILLDLFKFIDISNSNVDYKDSKKVFFVNDVDYDFKQEYYDLIKKYNFEVFRWSERENLKL